MHREGSRDLIKQVLVVNWKQIKPLNNCTSKRAGDITTKLQSWIGLDTAQVTHKNVQEASPKRVQNSRKMQKSLRANGRFVNRRVNSDGRFVHSGDVFPLLSPEVIG